MRSKLFLIALFGILFFMNNTKAQTFDLGLTAGVSSGTVKVSEVGTAFTNTIRGENILGFEGGLFLRMNAGPVFIKPMALLAYRGGPSDFVGPDGTVNSSRFSVGKLELPLLLGLKILGPIRIEAGPVYNWIFHESHSSDELINVRKSGFGYRVGANVEFGIINLGLAYQGLKNSSDGSGTATYATPDEVIFTLGLIFGGGD